MSTKDPTNAERQRRWRERHAINSADRKIMDAVREQVARDIAEGHMDPSGAVIRVPASLSREEWAAFIDREEARRAERDKAASPLLLTDGDA
jgi:hypothetical protein